MNYLKKLHMVFLSPEELKAFYKDYKRPQMIKALEDSGFTQSELKEDPSKLESIVDKFLEEQSLGKEEIEIFFVLFLHVQMYPEGSEIGFPLKDSCDPKAITSLKDLINKLKESTLTDFAIASSDRIRQFQLKQYRGATNTQELLTFLKKKLMHYGNDLGGVNLLVLLQSEGGVIDDIDIDLINEEICELVSVTTFEILISFNEMNSHNVIIRLYPTVATLRKKRENFLF